MMVHGVRLSSPTSQLRHCLTVFLRGVFAGMTTTTTITTTVWPSGAYICWDGNINNNFNNNNGSSWRCHVYIKDDFFLWHDVVVQTLCPFRGNDERMSLLNCLPLFSLSRRASRVQLSVLSGDKFRFISSFFIQRRCILPRPPTNRRVSPNIIPPLKIQVI